MDLWEQIAETSDDTIINFQTKYKDKCKDKGKDKDEDKDKVG